MFQFPSNGKVLSDHLRIINHKDRKFRFNSLQTGKSFRTKTAGSAGRLLQVSIPFKRESPFGPLKRQSRLQWLKSFNSLQTGKSFRTILAEHGREVDFMFQFPSNGKVLSDPNSTRGTDECRFHSFQFPSNGKVLSDVIVPRFCAPPQKRVSIPFKRESPFGHSCRVSNNNYGLCFNSLQTGKSFRTWWLWFKGQRWPS